MQTTQRKPFLRRWIRVTVACLIVLLVATSLPIIPNAPLPAPAVAAELPQQMRAFWVDSANPGFHNQEQVDELVNNVVRANANTIIAQMRRHGDAWYNLSREPRALITPLPPPEEFDPLAYLIAKAHQHNIKVHAWFVVSVVCRRSDPLWGHPDHVCTAHGPNARGTERWTTEAYNGTQIGDFDFGHPATVVYFENLVQELIRNYPDVDGIHLDYIRYGDRSYGYNQVSLDRFRRLHGLPADYRPRPNDWLWSEWRRNAVTEVMRRVYLRTKAIDPTIEVSAATITWGGVGSYSPDDWVNSEAYWNVFQDWRAWLQEGIVDFALPMHYFEEGTQRGRGWYESWIAWDRQNAGRRAIVSGLGAWLNSPEQTLAQAYKALDTNVDGQPLAGVAFYSYNEPMLGTSFQRRRQLMDYLSETIFVEPAIAPQWPWIHQPTRGHLMGIAQVDGQIVSDYRVLLFRNGEWVRNARTGYDGWYGAVDLEPGEYQVVIEHPQTGGRAVHTVAVLAGAVTQGP